MARPRQLVRVSWSSSSPMAWLYTSREAVSCLALWDTPPADTSRPSDSLPREDPHQVSNNTPSCWGELWWVLPVLSRTRVLFSCSQYTQNCEDNKWRISVNIPYGCKTPPETPRGMMIYVISYPCIRLWGTISRMGHQSGEGIRTVL